MSTEFTPEEKRQMSEADIRTKFITPAIVQAGWNERQISEEYSFSVLKPFTDGRMLIDPKTKQASRKEAKRADYLLYHSPNQKIAVVEAKDNKHSSRDGLQQAIDYAQLLDIPFAYSSNGDEFVEHDFLTGVQRTLPMNQFPTPDELSERFFSQYTPEQLKLIQQPYYTDANTFREPRYYQEIAINRTIEAVAHGQQRILIVMATGTGKTYTAFQIIHRLKASGAKKKILFLADRNILVDQPIREDFKPFKKVITKVQGKMDSAFEIYMALYQQLDGSPTAENELFKQFQPSFFDLIIIDECHRGSAKEDSNWRAILDYFDQATHIGMTATPKETADASNIHYFGDPIYTYSLKQGIEDGFLAPYRVIDVNLDCDLKGWRPPKGLLDKNGNPVEDRFYTVKDFDYNIVLDDRTRLVAERITEHLKQNNRNDKTIVFCANIDHAQRMVAELSRLNADMVQQNPKYIRQITGDQPSKTGDLEAFCDVKNEEKAYPVIAVTSKLMTTGVNSQTCKLVVLDANIQSMTEFKQIIGRGTRLRPEADKNFFTIMDFRGVSKLFADPDFDGEPVVILDPEPNPKPTKYPDPDNGNKPDKIEEDPKIYKPAIIIEAGKLELRIIDEKVQYLNEQGELVYEDIDQFSKRHIQQDFADFEQFKQQWQQGSETLSEKFYANNKWLVSLRKKAHLDDNIDDFDLLSSVAFNKTPLTKTERAERVKQSGYVEQYPEENQQVLGLLLDEYVKSGVKDLAKTELLQTPQFSPFGGLVSIIKKFGGKELYQKAVKGLEKMIYAE
ncbi:EcoAI/FtnUII family type I restriction enzme subunit R [Lonepinella sp. BR2271]|uniref:EcoAI/FtnUII family type I restriction enzme subunit R n=1 Tax=Lonepinella sp. BR2271 TaxID=3434550 RepID=UPI003F6DEC09